MKAREAAYDILVEEFPTTRGKELSAKERDEKGLRGGTLVYGEIRFEPYATAFLKIKQLYGGLAAPGGRFYDIGSGTGKPVFAAALMHQWDACIGAWACGCCCQPYNLRTHPPSHPPAP